MRERVVTFGDVQNLVGVFSEPTDTDPNQNGPCVLMLNAGILHHVGPFRLHVTAARRLAEQGYRVFRFDVSGIGDSFSVNEEGFDEKRLVADVRSAMDELERSKGINDFLLMGLCTGAANAHKVAVVDERVKGCVFLDGYAYPTWRFYWRHYIPRLLNPVRVISRLRKTTAMLLGGLTRKPSSVVALENFDWWQLPPRKELREELVVLVDRGVDLFYIQSGDRLEVCNYEEQFADAFPSIDFEGRLQVIINSESDHTYSTTEHRELLLDQISAWMAARDQRLAPKQV